MFAQKTTHFYHWVMTGFSVLLAGLYAASFFDRNFRVLYDKYLSDVPAWLTPFLLAAGGYMGGMALGGLFAPESFWKSSAGKNWLLVGSSGNLWWQRLVNRGKCLVLVALFAAVTEELIRLVYFDY